MSLHQVYGPAGPPWERPLSGRLDRLVVHSELLEDNPLDDPGQRPLYVYRAPGVADGAPASAGRLRDPGFHGQLDMWLSRSAVRADLVERIDAMFAAGDCPDAIVVLVDAWTSPWRIAVPHSAGTGRYLDYLCDEIVPFVDAALPDAAGPGHRGRREVLGRLRRDGGADAPP